MVDLESKAPPARRNRVSPVPRRRALATGLSAVILAGCTVTYDAGSSRPHGQLPVDERNPIVICNDSQNDNWQGEYAVLLANGGGPRLAGIVVNTSPNATDIEANFAARQGLLDAARKSGMRNLPELIKSVGPPLTRPPDGNIEATLPNDSEGAKFIASAASRLSLPYRPLVLVTGGRLTDVADAYLRDPKIVDQVVVVASLGSLTTSGATMGRPNGEMDPWADVIVASRFRYVQISAYYDQTADVPASRLGDLPANAFGTWMASRQPEIWDLPEAADQVGVAAVAVPGFVVEVRRASVSSPIDAGTTASPTLLDDPNGPLWLVRQISPSVAATRLWKILLDPKTYAP